DFLRAHGRDGARARCRRRSGRSTRRGLRLVLPRDWDWGAAGIAHVRRGVGSLRIRRRLRDGRVAVARRGPGAARGRSRTPRVNVVTPSEGVVIPSEGVVTLSEGVVTPREGVVIPERRCCHPERSEGSLFPIERPLSGREIPRRFTPRDDERRFTPRDDERRFTPRDDERRFTPRDDE